MKIALLLLLAVCALFAVGTEANPVLDDARAERIARGFFDFNQLLDFLPHVKDLLGIVGTFTENILGNQERAADAMEKIRIQSGPFFAAEPKSAAPAYEVDE